MCCSDTQNQNQPIFWPTRATGLFFSARASLSRLSPKLAALGGGPALCLGGRWRLSASHSTWRHRQCALRRGTSWTRSELPFFGYYSCDAVRIVVGLQKLEVLQKNTKSCCCCCCLMFLRALPQTWNVAFARCLGLPKSNCGDVDIDHKLLARSPD